MAHAHKEDETLRSALNVTEDQLSDMAELFKLYGALAGKQGGTGAAVRNADVRGSRG